MAEFSRDELLQKLSDGESLERADLSGIELNGASLVGANLARADLSGANLSGADLRDAILTNAVMQEAFLEGTNLEGAKLRNADLDGANLSGAVLQDADLSRANLEGSNLENAKLTGARLQNALLADANLGKADLSGATLRSADLTDTYLGGAGLQGADLRKATLEGTNLEEADLCEADLRECDLTTAVLEGTILEGAKVFGLTIDPDRLAQTLVEWWDVSRGGDGSVREEGEEVGSFLQPGVAASVPPQAAAAPAMPGTRYFGEGDVLKNAELEFTSESNVEVQGCFENCKIVLGEDARLKIGPTGVVRDCRIEGEGVVLIHGKMINGNGKTLTTSKVFYVGSTGTAVGTVKQPQGFTRFGFEPGCVLRLSITA